MFSPKTAVTYAGVLAAAVAVGLAAPALLAEAPRAYSLLSVCLTRPYLYFVINGIIISIAAASHFHKTPEPTAETSNPHTEEDRPKSQIAAPVIYGRAEEETVADVISQSIWPAPQQIESKEQQPMNGAKAQLDELRSIIAVPAIYTAADEASAAVEVHQVMPPAIQYRAAVAALAAEEVDVRGVIPPTIKPTLTKHRAAVEAAAEKPQAHSRIGGYQRRSSKILEGKALGVAKPKRGETLEGTWKAITDGRAVPLARHLKKSDTWADRGRKDEAAAPRLERKAETFSERNVRAPPRLHKEPSLGQDDLNRRVEAFINKFNEDMRLQRQESVQQYVDMINRGSHP